jgi:arylsulfatase A-like enzyme
MKNIILLITDTFRYDNIGDRCSTMPVRTPELNRFAADHATEVHGVIAGSFPTIPHRTDFASGRISWPFFGSQPIDVSGKNHVAAILGAKGYATQLISDNPALFEGRFDAPFTAAYHERGQEGDKPLLHLNDPIERAMDPEKTRVQPQFRGFNLVDVHRWINRAYRAEADTFAARVGNLACRWLEDNYASGPFFLWVDFFDPHEPWDPPEYLARRYDPDYRGPPMLHPNYGSSSVYTEAELRNLRAHYSAEAELVDRWLGRVLQKVDDLGMWHDTVVVVTSDHGMSLGEHERTGKLNLSAADNRYWPLYPEINHVPLLVAAPGVKSGTGLSILVESVDILPTMLELAEVSATPPEPFHGRSFAPVLSRGRGRFRDVVVSGCHVTGTPGMIPARSVTPFVTTHEWGYAPVGALGQPELYRMLTDPLATKDVANDHPEMVRELHGALLDHLSAHGAPPETIALWGRNPKLASDGTWSLDYH